jgi:hypothetical protein
LTIRDLKTLHIEPAESSLWMTIGSSSGVKKMTFAALSTVEGHWQLPRHPDKDMLMSLVRLDWDVNGLRRGLCFVRVTAQVLQSVQEAIGERSCEDIPRIASKLP